MGVGEQKRKGRAVYNCRGEERVGGGIFIGSFMEKEFSEFQSRVWLWVVEISKVVKKPSVALGGRVKRERKAHQGEMGG